jgi:hypothetical protein
MVTTSMRTAAIGIVAILLLATFGSLAMASGSASEQARNFAQELDSLAEADESGLAAADIQLARQWLAEANAAIERRDDRVVEYRLRRVDHSLDLIREIVQVGALRTATEAQKQRYEEAIAEIETLTGEIQELEERKANRERELRRVQEGE